MGTITAVNLNNLYWLGRYTERVFTTLNAFFAYHDRMVDVDENAYKAYLKKLYIPDIYEDQNDFLKKYVFDKNDINSIASNLDRALGNAIVLREEIKTPSLSYLQMASDKLSKIPGTDKLRFDLLPVRDYIYAFWGSIDDNMTNSESNQIIHFGKLVERTDLYLRLEASEERTSSELSSLLKIIPEYMGTKISLSKSDYDFLCSADIKKENYQRILSAIEKITEVNSGETSSV
ncbi:MAG: alpha-E domain-containing protein [Oscillospiraceae bacterium]|nr:alpha-E domain-containing protein [Oscillospiraceae bacterium]